MNIFKKKTSPKDALRTSKREMTVVTRGIERQIASLQMEEKRLVAEIKKTAKIGNEALYANTSISTRMKGATKAMTAMNKIQQMAPEKQTKVIKKLHKQSAQLDMTIEMMSESIYVTLGKDQAEEETEELKPGRLSRVLDEIGVDFASQLSSAPKGRIDAKTAFNNVAARPELLKLMTLKKGWPLSDESDRYPKTACCETAKGGGDTTELL